MGQKTCLAVHIGNNDVVIVLAEEQLRPVGGVGDSGERSGLQPLGRISRSARRNEALKNLSGHGIKYDDRLRRSHQQHGASMRGTIWIERKRLGAYGRSEFDDPSSRGQPLVVRDDNRAILLGAHGAIRAACLGDWRYAGNLVLSSRRNSCGGVLCRANIEIRAAFLGRLCLSVSQARAGEQAKQDRTNDRGHKRTFQAHV
jgi:hypothetical protein